MQFTRYLLSLLAAGSLQTANSLYMQLQYGGDWINVGTAQITDFAYGDAYSHFSATGGTYQSDQSGMTQSLICTDYDNGDYPDPDVTFKVTGQASYGDDDDLGLTGWNFRDLFIHTMYDGILKASDPTASTVCSPNVNVAGCQGMACASQCSATTNFKCTSTLWSHSMPSIWRVNTYEDDGSLRPEYFELQLEPVVSQDSSSSGCSVAVNELALAVGLVPGVGSTIKTAVQIVCTLL